MFQVPVFLLYMRTSGKVPQYPHGQHEDKTAYLKKVVGKKPIAFHLKTDFNIQTINARGK